MARPLYTGDAFPPIVLQLVGGGSFQVPQDIDGKYLIAIFYRGHW